MPYPIIEHLFSAILFLAIIIFFELWVQFRRPLVLKVWLMGMVFSIGCSCAGIIYSLHYGYNRWFIEFPMTIMSISVLNFYSFLFNHGLKRFVLWFGTAVIFGQIVFYLVYYYIFNIDAGVNLLENTEYKLFNVTLKSLAFIIFAFLTFDLYLKIRNKYQSDNAYFKMTRRWSIFGILAFLVIFPNRLFKTFGLYNTNTSMVITIIIYLIILLYILFRPRFINRTNLKISLSQAFNKIEQQQFSVDHFESHFYNEAFYRNRNASLEDFGKIMKVSPEQLNKFIYQNYTSSFSDLVNKARVEYFVNVVNDGQHSNFTIESLALLSGFGSRQSLYKQFKKFHGGNPSDLLNSTLR